MVFEKQFYGREESLEARSGAKPVLMKLENSNTLCKIAFFSGSIILVWSAAVTEFLGLI